jgi:uncharacterized protein
VRARVAVVVTRARVVVTAAALVALAVAAGTVGCDRTTPPPLDRLVIATGGAGGVYDALGRTLADAAHRRWGLRVEVRATAGSEENLRLVADGRADLAFARVDVAGLARGGDHPFASALPIVALAGLYDDYLHIVVPAASRIRSVADLATAVVSTGEAGTTETLAERTLVAGGLDLDQVARRRLSAVDSAEALRTGTIDAFFVTGGIPMPVVANLARRMPIRLLSIPDEVGELESRFGEDYRVRSIPPSAYGLDVETITAGVPNVLVVRDDLAEEAAYGLTELLFAAKAELVRAHPEARRLDPRAALATFPLPLHPGADRYYRRTKPMAAPVTWSAAPVILERLNMAPPVGAQPWLLRWEPSMGDGPAIR